MQLEFALAGDQSEQAYRCDVTESAAVTAGTESAPAGRSGPRFIVNWGPMVREMMVDVRKCLPRSLISKKFHNALIRSIVEVARGQGWIGLCFLGGVSRTGSSAKGS